MIDGVAYCVTSASEFADNLGQKSCSSIEEGYLAGNGFAGEDQLEFGFMEVFS